MYLLAIETSERIGSVAIVQQGRTVSEQRLPLERRSAQTLAPAVDALLRQYPREQLSAVAVSVGPGSFTGLRVGIATAKTLAWALQTPVIGVSTLEVIGCQCVDWLRNGRTPLPPRISVAANAYRAQVFESHGDVSAHGDVAWSEARIVAFDKWLEGLGADRECWAGGPALSLPRTPRQQAALDASRLVHESAWTPSAATVGRLGWQAWQAGQATPAAELLPIYGRASAAEERADG